MNWYGGNTKTTGRTAQTSFLNSPTRHQAADEKQKLSAMFVAWKLAVVAVYVALAVQVGATQGRVQDGGDGSSTPASRRVRWYVNGDVDANVAFAKAHPGALTGFYLCCNILKVDSNGKSVQTSSRRRRLSTFSSSTPTISSSATNTDALDTVLYSATCRHCVARWRQDTAKAAGRRRTA